MSRVSATSPTSSAPSAGTMAAQGNEPHILGLRESLTVQIIDAGTSVSHHNPGSSFPMRGQVSQVHNQGQTAQVQTENGDVFTVELPKQTRLSVGQQIIITQDPQSSTQTSAVITVIPPDSEGQAPTSPSPAAPSSSDPDVVIEQGKSPALSSLHDIEVRLRNIAQSRLDTASGDSLPVTTRPVSLSAVMKYISSQIQTPADPLSFPHIARDLLPLQISQTGVVAVMDDAIMGTHTSNLLASLLMDSDGLSGWILPGASGSHGSSMLFPSLSSSFSTSLSMGTPSSPFYIDISSLSFMSPTTATSSSSALHPSTFYFPPSGHTMPSITPFIYPSGSALHLIEAAAQNLYPLMGAGQIPLVSLGAMENSSMTLFMGITMAKDHPIPFFVEGTSPLLSSTTIAYGRTLLTMPGAGPWAGSPSSITHPFIDTFSGLLQDWQVLDPAFIPAGYHASITALPSAQSPQTLLPSALFFMAALRSGDLSGWLGDRNIDVLRRAGKGGQLDKLMVEFSRLKTQMESISTQDIRSFAFPLVFQDELKLAYLHIKKDTSDDLTEDQKGKTTRFVLDIEFDRIGPVQLDMLYRPGILDTILRTELPLSMAMRTEMEDMYKKALSSTRTSGSLLFQNDPHAWVKINPATDHMHVMV
jgi:hypothetical protein